MSQVLRLLLVEDSEDDAALELQILRSGGYEVEYQRVENRESLLQCLEDGSWDIVISDYRLPGFNALEALSIVKEKGFTMPFLVVSGTIGEEIAVEAVKAGASDYIMKDKLARLLPAVARELRETETRQKLHAAEERLRLFERLEAVGRLAGGIAHDFNNLLTAINGYADLVLEELGRENPLYGDVEEIKKAGLKAAGLTRQLLAFSRRQILQPKVMDLNATVAGAENMLRRLIGEDVEVAIFLNAKNARIKADPTQIEQVILNLAINSRDAMPQGGKLTIETAEIFLNENYAKQHIATTTGPYVLLAVSDNGCGIAKENLAHIFEPFYTTKKMGEGTGLGLSTVYGIVKQSGGNVWVYTEPGEGTTFKVYLPQVDQSFKVKEEPKRSASARGDETVLLVEDEELVRVLVRQVLKKNGYTVLEAGNGKKALELYREHKGPLHLVLTDVVMPEMSGREMVVELKRQHSVLKVLYMSGYTDDTIVHHGILEPGTAFIQKPFTPEALAWKVREVLDEP